MRAALVLSRVALAAALLLGACKPKTEAPPELKRVQFGVFFGPEIQELREIPLEQDAAGKGLGIRLLFATPPDPPRKVRWELERPRKPKLAPKGNAGAKASKAPVPDAATDAGLSLDRIVQYGDATTRAGETVLDIPLALRPGDPLGDWNVRVWLDEQQVLNRPFQVVRPKPKKSGTSY